MTVLFRRVGGSTIQITGAPHASFIDQERVGAVLDAKVLPGVAEITWRELEILAPSVGPGWSLLLPERESHPGRSYTSAMIEAGALGL
jgi:hypothetical protein